MRVSKHTCFSIERKEPKTMYPSHLLSDYISQRQAAALQEAEQARLLRLARAETGTFPHHWLAIVRQFHTRLFGNTIAAQHHTATWVNEHCCVPVLTGAPGAACCAL